MDRYLPAWLLFASDAVLLGLSGAGFLALAVLALIMDRRRHRRDRVGGPDRAGWMPWTLLFLLSATLGAGLLAVAVPSLLNG